MRIALATRGMTEELYKLSVDSTRDLPFPRHYLRDLEAEEYLYALLDIDADWVINIDEDVFLTKPDSLMQIIEYMQQNDYSCAGMPDGGVCDHRFHNPLALNAFFTILNLNMIRETFRPKNNAVLVHKKEWEALFPSNLLRGNYSFDNFEPYYPFFFWLLENNHKFLFLDALSWNRDTTSTILLDHKQTPFLLHCWYGRAFYEQKPRFLNASRFAGAIREKRQNAKS